jgi:tetratricopeptide (TPR) repeat protein
MFTYRWRLVRHACAVLVLAAFAAACSEDPEQAKQQYFESGNRYFAEGKYQEALVQFRNALQRDPRFGEAHLRLAATYEQLGDGRNAMREYVRAADALPQSLEAQIKAASYLLLARQFEDVRARAQAALAIDPKSVDAQILLGNALGGLRDFEAALRELEEAVKLDPTSSVALSAVGSAQLAQGRVDAAAAAFRQAVEANPGVAEPHLALANFLWARGQVGQAEESLKKALAIHPGNLIAHRALATLYLTSGRASEAEPHLKSLAEDDRSSGASLKLALADYYMLTNRAEDALRVLESLVSAKDTQSAADTRRATIAFVRGNTAEGHRVIDAVLARDPRNLPALLVKSRFELAEGRLEGALRHAQAAVAANPQSIQARYLSGTILRGLHKPKEATEAFNEVLKINPRATAAQVQLAQLHLEQRQAPAALQLARDAARSVPNDPEVQLTLLRSMLANGQVDQAQLLVSKLMKALPKESAVHVAAALVASSKQDIAGARQAFERAIALNADNFDAVNGLTRLELADRKPAAARVRVDEELAKRPGDPRVLNLAARVYASLDDLSRAEELLRRSIDVDPSGPEAYSMLGWLYARQQRLPEARANFERLLQQRPGDVGAQTLVAMLYESEGNLDEARKHYERILQIDPAAPVAANNLAYRYVQDGGNLDVALQLAQTARQRLPDSAEVADTLGWIYVKKDLASLAVIHLEAAISKAPSEGLYHYHLGVALHQLGQKIRSRRVLERALSLNLPASDAEQARALLAAIS